VQMLQRTPTLKLVAISTREGQGWRVCNAARRNAWLSWRLPYQWETSVKALRQDACTHAPPRCMHSEPPYCFSLCLPACMPACLLLVLALRAASAMCTHTHTKCKPTEAQVVHAQTCPLILDLLRPAIFLTCPRLHGMSCDGLGSWFCSVPTVDTDRLLVVGHSLGGYHSLRLASGLLSLPISPSPSPSPSLPPSLSS
jgi:hypothetical protein